MATSVFHLTSAAVGLAQQSIGKLNYIYWIMLMSALVISFRIHMYDSVVATTTIIIINGDATTTNNGNVGRLRLRRAGLIGSCTQGRF